ncbi:hypothetical protein BH11ACT7_BH11ACT7_04460 [soil metagenome]
MAEPDDLLARLRMRQTHEQHAERRACEEKFHKEFDSLLPKIQRAAQELLRTDYPTIRENGVFFEPISINGAETPAWQLLFPLEADAFGSGLYFITHDGKLVGHEKKPVYDGNYRKTGDYTYCTWNPRDEVALGRVNGYGMPICMSEIRSGLDYLLNGLDRL